jgi:hypothetical protein
MNTEDREPIEVDGKPIDYDGLPVSLRDGMRRYLIEKIAPGDFLTAVLQNDFRGAVLRADELTYLVLPEIARWLHWHAPSESYGSVDKFMEWLK